MQDIVIRDFDSITDEPFVIDSWMKSFYANSPFTVGISLREFRLRHLPIIKRLIKDCKTRMVTKADEPDVLVGYIVYEPDALHYLYIKELFRGFGIARRLLSECQFPLLARVTHLTERGKKMLDKKHFVYSPYFGE